MVKQFFESQVYDEYVIKGNAAIFKCQTPSFVADHVDITDWIDTEGGTFTKNITGRTHRRVDCRLNSHMKGDPAIIVATLNFMIFPRSSLNQSFRKLAVVPQSYTVNVMDESILRGNSAILKCHIPSFVADFIVVDSWVEDEERVIYPQEDIAASGN